MVVVSIIIAGVLAGSLGLFLVRDLEEKETAAEFQITEFTLSDSKIQPGQTVTVRLVLKNVGVKRGTKKLKFYLAGDLVSKSVTLDPGENETISLFVSKERVGSYKVKVSVMSRSFEVLPFGEKGEIENALIVDIYNNYPYVPNLQTSWGFSCLLRTEDESVLFDTGGDSQILLNNMEKLGVDPEKIDTVFLSHIHGDHVGGLSGFLDSNSDVVVCLPESFPESFKNEVVSAGSDYVEISSPQNIAPDISTTGELEGPPMEQSMIVSTERGLIVITGCAHPGIVRIVRKAKKLENRKVYLVMGGFHLSGVSEKKLRDIIDSFRDLGVRKVAPSHCSGDKCRRLFREEYRENYVQDGVGRVIRMGGPDIKEVISEKN